MWPWVLTATLLLARRRARALLPAVVTVALLSFGYSLWHTHAQPTWAYFGTFDRAWELAVGAALALGAARGARLPRTLEPVAGWLGLAGILLSLFVVRPGIAFPAPWAALPVLSTALVIAAGARREQRWLLPLVNPASRYVGDISYSVYLWHFPAVILVAAFFPLHGPAYVVWVLGLTATLSVASYHFIEDPVRRSSWLEPASRKQARRDRRRPAHGSKPVVALALVLLAATTVVTSQVVGGPRGSTTVAALSPDDVGPGASRRDKAIASALAATDFPDLSPDLGELGVQKWKDDLVRTTGCYDVYPDIVDSCVNGDPNAPHRAVVVGDSVAMSYMPGIVRALTPSGYRIQQLTKGQCPVWDVPVDLNGGGSFTSCDRYRDWAAGVVDRQRPELAVLVTAYGTVSRLSSKADGPDAVAEIRAGLARQIRRLQRSADRVVVLEPAPQVDHGLQDCVGRFARPADCVVRIAKDFELVERAERRAAADTGATYVTTRSWFCARNGACPAFVGHTPVRVDRTHLSIEYSTGLAPMLRRSLLHT